MSVSKQDDDEDAETRSDPDTGALAIAPLGPAKWFVPSVTILFIVIGYIVETAQESLLGLGSTDPDPNRYFTSAADFAFAILSTTANWLSLLLSLKPIPFGGHFISIAALTAMTCLVIILPHKLASRYPGLNRHLDRWKLAVLIVLLIAITGYKFLQFDAPLSRVDGIILGKDQSDFGGAHDVSFGLTFNERLHMDGGKHSWGGNEITARATTLWQDIVCSRVADSLNSKGGAQAAESDIRCSKSQTDSLNALDGEFFSDLWTMVLVGMLATRLYRSAGSTAIATVSLLALLSSLTVPYAYGKLKRSTYFDYGLVKVAPTLTEAVGPSSDQRTQPNFYALILSQSNANTRLLVVQRGACQGSGNYSAVRLASLSPGQVLSVEEIYRQDVITWSTLNEHACGPAQEPEGVIR